MRLTFIKKTMHISELILFLGVVLTPAFFVYSYVSAVVDNSRYVSAPLPDVQLLIHLIGWGMVEFVTVILWMLIRKIRKAKEVNTPTDQLGRFLGKKKWYFIPITVFLMFITLLISLISKQNKILFPSARGYIRDIKSFYNLKEISVGNSRLKGYYVDSGNDYLLVIYYGNAQSASQVIKYLYNNAQSIIQEYDILVIDYPGYGKNDGTANEKSIHEMTEAEYEYVSKMEYKAKYVMGYSIGTGAAVYSAYQHEWDGMVLIAPFDNMINVINSYLPIFRGPFKGLVTNTFPNDKYAATISEKSLIIASVSDEVINVARAEALYDIFENKGEFIKMQDLSHAELFSNESVWDEIAEFLKSLQLP